MRVRVNATRGIQTETLPTDRIRRGGGALATALATPLLVPFLAVWFLDLTLAVLQAPVAAVMARHGSAWALVPALGP